MNKVKYAKNILSRKPGILLVSLLLIFTITTIGTIAFLVDETETIKNTFTPGNTGNNIIETIDVGVKKNVMVENSGTVPVYVRAAVLFSWKDAQGNVYNTVPVEGKDNSTTGDYHYIIEWTMAGWEKGADGYYYYTTPVAANGSTGVLFTDCEPVSAAPDGFNFTVEILTQTIQADGVKKVEEEGQIVEIPAVTDAWGIAVNADGTLKIQ